MSPIPPFSIMSQLKKYEFWVSISKVIFFIALIFTIACNKNERKQDRAKQILRTSLDSDLPNLDPRAKTDCISDNVMKMLFSGLVSYSQNNCITLEIAKSYKASSKYKTYIFSLKKTKWSDGTPLTAYDFEHSWKELLLTDFPGAAIDLLYLIKNAKKAKQGTCPLKKVGIKALDDYTLRIDLENSQPTFINILTHHTFYPIHSSMRGKIMRTKDLKSSELTCSGPFKLKEQAFQDQLVLEKNSFYWNAKQVRLDEIEFKMIKDEKTALLMFEQGLLDWLGSPFFEISSTSLQGLKQQGNLKTSQIAATRFLEFNVQRFPFDNASIRKALCYAIDRASLLQTILHVGEGALALGLIPPVVKEKHWHPFFQDHDIVRARAYFEKGLDELGITLEEFPKLTLLYPSSEPWHKIMQSIQQQWQDAFGIRCELESHDWKDLVGKLRSGDFEIGRYGWTLPYNDSSNLLELFKSASHPHNHTRWQHPEYIHFLDQARHTKAPSIRAESLEAAERLLMEEMPIIPLDYIARPSIQQPNLKGVVFDFHGVDFRYVHFK
ncbi:MAG: peptide ABC transporter substrate-binding protein [Anaerolineae bacterium]